MSIIFALQEQFTDIFQGLQRVGGMEHGLIVFPLLGSKLLSVLICP